MNDFFGIIGLVVLVAGIVAVAELLAQPSQANYARWGRDWEHL